MAARKNSQNNAMIVIGLVLIIAGVGGTYQYLAPQLNQANADYQKALATGSAKGSEVMELQDAQNVIAQVKANLPSNENVSIVSSIYPSNEDVPGLYVQLENLKQQSSGVSNLSYQVGKPAMVTGGTSVAIPVTLTATGSYSDLKNLLALWESNIRPIQFTSITLTLNDQGQYAMSATGQTLAAGLSSAYSSSTSSN